MTSSEVREKYLKFFEDQGHVRIPPAPLVLENDPTTLFTSAGMQPLIPYLKGESHPKGKRLVDSQPSIRLQDIEEVGDNRHTTFFEMLGNWSLGDYFKTEQLPWIWEFFTKELGLDPKKLYVSVFEGTKDVPKDEESYEVWKKLGVPDERIFFYGVKKNWWSNSGTPEEMMAGDIGGPDSEVFYDFGTAHDKKYGEKCHSNCECGRFLEIGNSVFIQYEKQKDGSLKELPNKNVDFGGGLERITAAVNNEPDIFQIDLFSPIIKEIEANTDKLYKETENKPAMRVIADHLRAAVFLIIGGVTPSNKTQGYVLRRLLRRSAVKMHQLGGGLTPIPGFHGIADEILKTYNLEISKTRELVSSVIEEELSKFGSSLDRGLKVLDAYSKDQLTTLNAFGLYQSYGFPFEIAKELIEKKGGKVSKEEFNRIFRDHQELSRKTAAKLFKGGLADTSEEVTKLHTATHLLHAALRKVLGEHVGQTGSNITSERLRFDFSHPQKLTDEELKKVEEMINEKIKEDLAVTVKEETLNEAIAEGALHFFGEKYGEKVKVYTIGLFSKEVCGGPHVTNTAALGHAKIIKQEKLGANTIRVYMTLEK